MRRNAHCCIRCLVVLAALLIGAPAMADGPSTHPITGIASQVLQDVYALFGAAVAIGQVETGRPGRTAMPPGDDAANSNSTVAPRAVFTQDGPAIRNRNTSNHAESVAGIMISSHPLYESVAPLALLHSSAIAPIGNPTQQMQQAVLAMQHIARQNPNGFDPDGDVRVINMSVSQGGALDASSLTTLALDYFARRHNTLYVNARGNQGNNNLVPADSFNGLNVAFTELRGGLKPLRLKEAETMAQAQHAVPSPTPSLPLGRCWVAACWPLPCTAGSVS